MTQDNGHTAARRRIEKFVSEWPKGSHRGDMIHGLHMGDPREAELRLSDLKALLDETSAAPDLVEALEDARQFAVCAIKAAIDLPDFDPTHTHVLVRKIDAALLQARGEAG